MTHGDPAIHRYSGQAQRIALLCALGGTLASLVGLVWNPALFFRAYLVAYTFWLGLALGCLVLLMIQYLTGGGWGLLLRRVLEAGSRTLLPLVLLFLPLLIGLHSIYPWTTQAPGDQSGRAIYLKVGFFLGRAAFYFVVWLILGYLLNRWSTDLESGRIPRSTRRFRLLSGPGLVLYGFTITFASVDWVMSLEPKWVSTIFPPLYAVGQLLTGLSFAVATLLLLSRYSSIGVNLRPNHLRDLGNLLLTFVMLWAYISFSQFLLIWVESLPEEIPWYLRRTRGGWQMLAFLLVVFQFGLPFLMLLSRKVKENSPSLATIAGLILAMRFFDLLWWIEPAYPERTAWFLVLDVSTWIGLGGFLMWWFLRKLRERSLLPLHDPYLAHYLPEAVPNE